MPTEPGDITVDPGRRLFQQAPKLLLVRNDNIGDLICSIPSIQLVRDQFPNSEIHLLVNSYNAPVVECLCPKWVNRLIIYRKTKHAGLDFSQLAHLGSFYVGLWKERYDITVLLVGGVSRQALSFAKWSRSHRVISYGSQTDSPSFLEGLHEVEYSWRLVAHLCGISDSPPQQIDYPIRATGNRVAIQITSRKPGNRWDAGRFIELARALHAHTQQRPLLLWSPGNEKTATHPGDDTKALDILKATSSILDPTPTSTLDELSSALQTCRYVVTPDGGAMHLASAMGVRIVSLFGQSEPSRWRPWTPHARVLQSPSRTIQDISTDQVMSAFKDLESQF